MHRKAQIFIHVNVYSYYWILRSGCLIAGTAKSDTYGKLKALNLLSGRSTYSFRVVRIFELTTRNVHETKYILYFTRHFIYPS